MLAKYTMLGVINRTPNSFSDQGKSLNPDFFHHQLTSFLSDDCLIPDIGFESTAPMNVAVSKSIELERFNSFLEESRNYCFKKRFVSFDTYRPESFLFMAREFRRIHPESYVIFNDVSGVLDDELKAALISFSGEMKKEEFYYIYTFSHIPSRDKVLNHMTYVNEKIEIVQETQVAIKKAHEWLKAIGMNQVIFDPGFGFSKSYEQNWDLINGLTRLKVDGPLLLGLSKKSFLKKALKDPNPIELEQLHFKCIQKILSENRDKKVLFRVHEPSLFKELL